MREGNSSGFDRLTSQYFICSRKLNLERTANRTKFFWQFPSTERLNQIRCFGKKGKLGVKTAETSTAQWKDEVQEKWHRMSVDSAINSLEDMWMTSSSGCPDWMLHSEERLAWILISAGFDTADSDLSMAFWRESDGCPFRTLQIDSELHIHLLTDSLLSSLLHCCSLNAVLSWLALL